jgi:hypothetical protein
MAVCGCQKTMWRERRCAEKPVRPVQRNCGGRVWCDRHFGAAVRRKVGAAEKLVLRCRRKAGCWSVLVPFPSRFSSEPCGFVD